MSEKKTVGRRIAITLVTLCVLLVAGFAYYVIETNNNISALNSQLSDKNIQISGLNTTVTDLNTKVRDLSEIVSLSRSKVIYNTSSIVSDPPFQGLDLPHTFIDVDHCQIGSAALSAGYVGFAYVGYIVVKINSTSDDTYINYTCISHHIGTFSLQTDIGLNGTATLPVLPLAPYYGDYYHPEEGIFITISTHTSIPARINTTMTYYY